MLLTAVAAPTVTSGRAIGLRTLYRLSPLGVVGLIGTGVGTSGLFSLAPVYANQEGLSVAAISTFMAAMTLGGVAFQLPVGRLSDRLDRRWVIAAVTLLTGLALLPPALLPQIPSAMLYPGFFLVGGLSLPVYALCVAHTNDFLNSEQMVGASSALVLAFGIGAAAGPTLTALSMQLFGTPGFPIVPGRGAPRHRPVRDLADDAAGAGADDRPRRLHLAADANAGRDPDGAGEGGGALAHNDRGRRRCG